MFSVITNICNKKTKGPTLMEMFTATGKLKKFFLTAVQCSGNQPRTSLLDTCHPNPWHAPVGCYYSV